MNIDSGTIVMEGVPSYLDAGDNEPIRIDNRAAALSAWTADHEYAVEGVVMDLIVGDASGSDGEFSVTVIELDARTIIVVNQAGIDTAMFGILNVNSVACAV